MYELPPPCAPAPTRKSLRRQSHRDFFADFASKTDVDEALDETCEGKYAYYLPQHMGGTRCSKRQRCAAEIERIVVMGEKLLQDLPFLQRLKMLQKLQRTTCTTRVTPPAAQQVTAPTTPVVVVVCYYRHNLLLSLLFVIVVAYSLWCHKEDVSYNCRCICFIVVVTCYYCCCRLLLPLLFDCLQHLPHHLLLLLFRDHPPCLLLLRLRYYLQLLHHHVPHLDKSVGVLPKHADLYNFVTKCSATTRWNVAATRHLARGHPDRFDLTTPQSVWSAVSHTWEYAPTPQRIVQDIQRVFDAIDMVVDARGKSVDFDGLRHGHRLDEHQRASRVSRRSSKLSSKPKFGDVEGLHPVSKQCIGNCFDLTLD